jgi:hypothetical protein
MTRISYIKDTNKFWQTRKEARTALDKKRASASYAVKVETAQKLRSDAAFLKSGRKVSSKS